jgi:L-fuculose-phosphate aldolase
LREDDLIILDLSGTIPKLKSTLKPSTETPMHFEVYKQRPDVHAVIHAHPVFATSLSVAGLEFPNDILPEVILTLGGVPTTNYATPSSEQDARAVRDLIRNHDAILLRQHGSLTVGKNLEEALNHLERIEHVAEVFWRARALGKVKKIPTREKKRLSEMRATAQLSGE